jgi:uncharacterized protein
MRAAVISGSVAAALITVAFTLAVDPQLRRDVTYGGGFALLVSWGPLAAAGLLCGLLTARYGQRSELDARARVALTSQPVRSQLLWLGFCLVACVVFMGLLDWLLEGLDLEAPVGMLALMSLAPRLLFFLALPAIAIDRLLNALVGGGTPLSDMAVRVSEGWRWLGLAAIPLAVVLMGALLNPFRSPWQPAAIVLGVVVAYLVAAACEEAFFRGMLQSRFEFLWGRWAGIITTSLLFALFYAFVQVYLLLIPLPGDTLVHNLGMALLTYTPVGLLCGYFWSCYRNIWLNILLRTSLLLTAYPPLA